MQAIEGPHRLTIITTHHHHQSHRVHFAITKTYHGDGHSSINALCILYNVSKLAKIYTLFNKNTGILHVFNITVKIDQMDVTTTPPAYNNKILLM